MRYAVLFAIVLLSRIAAAEQTPAPAAPDSLQQTQQALMRVASKVAPSVVALRITPRPSAGAAEVALGMDSKLMNQGSGVIVNDDGAILTNAHVVLGAAVIHVLLSDGRSYRAEVLGADMRSDLAVVKIDADPPLPVCRFADDKDVEIGQFAIALGNPFGLSNTITLGVVSATDRALPRQYAAASDIDLYYGHLIQTDAAINPGNSGGPLVDIQGRVIGINVLIFTRTRAGQGVGFAIPADTVRHHLPYLLKGEEVPYGYLGLLPKNLNGELARSFGVPARSGILIDRVMPDGPADDAGLRPGMVLTRYGARDITGSDDLIHYVGLTEPGTVIPITVRRADGTSETLEVTVGKRPKLGKTFRELEALDEAVSARPDEDDDAWRGIKIRDMSRAERNRWGDGLIVERVRPWSVASHAGLSAPDRIERFGPSADKLQPVESAEAFLQAVDDMSGTVLIECARNGFVAVPHE